MRGFVLSAAETLEGPSTSLQSIEHCPLDLHIMLAGAAIATLSKSVREMAELCGVDADHAEDALIKAVNTYRNGESHGKTIITTREPQESDHEDDQHPGS